MSLIDCEEVRRLPNSQRAWLVTRRGAPETALVYRSDVPLPSRLGRGEVLIKVQAAALNPVGYKLMAMVPNFLAKRPRVAEYDVAGTIVDGNETNFHVGDQVFGFITQALWTGHGALAEYIRLPACTLMTRPPNLTPVQACGIPLAAQTAYQALVEIAKVEPGQTIFINGGSTAVGAFAIQIAKARGCQTVVSASAQSERFVRELGASGFIDYTKTPLDQYLIKHPPSPKFHVILEAVGLIDPVLFTSSSAYLAPGGVFISVGPQPRSFAWHDMSNTMRFITQVLLRPTWLGGLNRKWTYVHVNHNRSSLDSLQRLITQGEIKPVIDSVYPFDGVMDAYKRVMTSRAKGKIIVQIEEN
ncbi:hypothetical protein BD779DRAFT_1674317 [Infundibulicybe gibba]|nr:hypothetical protein BD779DRAFT_1674317 [Infundibulicybe gibba]